jgi:hypothetical protein|tara:strand:+ start:2156 stop:2362 length:207 start_codon:yes stop_codon:yes gene_type:complete
MNTNDPKSWDKEMSVAQIFGQMVAGSIFTAIALGVPIVFIAGLYFIGTFLAPESKEAIDPTPDSFLQS